MKKEMESKREEDECRKQAETHPKVTEGTKKLKEQHSIFR